MNDDNKKDLSEVVASRYYPRTGIIIDGEVFLSLCLVKNMMII